MEKMRQKNNPRDQSCNHRTNVRWEFQLNAATFHQLFDNFEGERTTYKNFAYQSRNIKFHTVEMPFLILIALPPLFLCRKYCTVLQNNISIQFLPDQRPSKDKNYRRCWLFIFKSFRRFIQATAENFDTIRAKNTGSIPNEVVSWNQLVHTEHMKVFFTEFFCQYLHNVSAFCAGNRIIATNIYLYFREEEAILGTDAGMERPDQNSVFYGHCFLGESRYKWNQMCTQRATSGGGDDRGDYIWTFPRWHHQKSMNSFFQNEDTFHIWINIQTHIASIWSFTLCLAESGIIIIR